MNKPHAVCIPFQAQSHITALLNVAKILHHRGFFITFVNSDFNHRRLLNSGGLTSSVGLPDWRFVSIHDGLPPSDADSTQDIRALCDSARFYMEGPFLDLVTRMHEDVSMADFPPISHIVSDFNMNYTVRPAAEKLGVPLIHLFPISACAVLAFMHYRMFIERCLKPLKDESSKIGGDSFDRVIDWIPGMNNMRLRDMPYLFGEVDENDSLLGFCLDMLDRTDKAEATIIHTFEELEPVVLDALSSIIPNVHAIGPIHLLLEQIPQDETISKHVLGNLWEEQPECLEWLDSKEPGSVLYVNFGSIVVLTQDQLTELAAGLANSKYPFLWVLRPDLMAGEAAVLPPGFIEETKDRGFLSGWCPQEKVLNHASVGGFLTHCGWNSILESLSAGVPMICWPNMGDQQTNARYVCEEWKVGLEVGTEVRRADFEEVVGELLGGEKGKELKRRAVELKRLAEEAVSPTGSSTTNLEKLITRVFA